MKRFFSVATSLAVAASFSFMLLGVVSAPGADAATPVPHAVNGKIVHKRLLAAIKALPKAGETPKGYARSKFKIWVDANHDCQDTRSEVLRQEKKSKKVTGACAVKTGKWVSVYDNKTFYKASKLDIDHRVPLAEAWKSGAKHWGAAKREAYANDLTDPRTLVAVSAHANRSKGDRDPSKWMPAKNKCTYLKQWVAVKIRWRLHANGPEKTALLHKAKANHCGNPVLTVHYALVKGGTTSTSGGSGGGGGTGGGSGLDPQFATCTAAEAAGYGPYYAGIDPEYNWYTDADSDGIVCE